MISGVLSSARSCELDIDPVRGEALGGNQRHTVRLPRKKELWLTTLTNLAVEPCIEAADSGSEAQSVLHNECAYRSIKLGWRCNSESRFVGPVPEARCSWVNWDSATVRG